MYVLIGNETRSAATLSKMLVLDIGDWMDRRSGGDDIRNVPSYSVFSLQIVVTF